MTEFENICTATTVARRGNARHTGLTYDAWNQLIQVNATDGSMIASYSYDGIGHRLTETPSNAHTTQLYYSASWQVIEEDVGSSGLTMSARYVWSPVYVNALILRDYDFNGGAGVQVTERTYALQDANYNVTSLGDGEGSQIVFGSHW